MVLIIRRLVLDVLKPHNPSKIDLSKKLSELKGVDGVNIITIEIDKEVENVKIVLEGTNISFSRVKKILEEIGKCNTSTDFHCRGVVDTHHFSPYNKEEEAQILVKTENEYYIKSLSDCSPFIKGFQSDEGYNEYNVRICFLDITMSDMVMENIKSLLDGASIVYEVKKYGF